MENNDTQTEDQDNILDETSIETTEETTAEPKGPFLRKEEDGVYLGEDKIAYYVDGKLRMNKGYTKLREEIELFLENGTPVEESFEPEEIPDRPITGLTDAHLGDHSPEVRDWFRKYKAKEYFDMYGQEA